MQIKSQLDNETPNISSAGDPRRSGSEATVSLRVLVLSDVQLCREGLALILTRYCHADVIGSASPPTDLCEIAALRPDVVLLDVSNAGALALAKQLNIAVPDVKIIAFALGDVDKEIVACAEAGISAYLTRDSSAEKLVEVIHQSLRGEFACSPRITCLLFRRLASLSAATSGFSPGDDPDLLRPPFTYRERQIVPLIEQGLSNKEIARRLSIEASTIKNHVHNILKKMNLRRRGEIAAQIRRSRACESRKQTVL
jgi:two-component system nitrate/nitrite response regulator NarL